MKPQIPRKGNYLSALPEHVRLQINCKLRDGWRHCAIAEWLLTQKADRDIPEHLLKTGDPYALIWTRRAHGEEVVQENCRMTITRWCHGPYQEWCAEQPKPQVPLGTPRAIKIAFRTLYEEIRDNHQAVNLLERLRRAVRRGLGEGGSPPR
jgi:kynureninase